MTNVTEEQVDDFFDIICNRHDFGDGKGFVPAHRHKNLDGSIGGWVADSARVDPINYISHNSKIYQKAVLNPYNIIVSNSRIFGNAFLSGHNNVYKSQLQKGVLAENRQLLKNKMYDYSPITEILNFFHYNPSHPDNFWEEIFEHYYPNKYDLREEIVTWLQKNK